MSTNVLGYRYVYIIDIPTHWLGEMDNKRSLTWLKFFGSTSNLIWQLGSIGEEFETYEKLILNHIFILYNLKQRPGEVVSIMYINK